MGSLYICSALPCVLPGLPNDFCQVCKANCEATYHLMGLTGMVAIKINLFQLKNTYCGCFLRCVFCSPVDILLIYKVLNHVKTTAGGGADSQVAQKDDGRCWWKQCLPTWRSGDDPCVMRTSSASVHVFSYRPYSLEIHYRQSWSTWSTSSFSIFSSFSSSILQWFS